MRYVNRQGFRSLANLRRRILTRRPARWRERAVRTPTYLLPLTTIEELSPIRRASPRYYRQARCVCCAILGFASLRSGLATRAMRRIRRGLTGSRFFSTEPIHLLIMFGRREWI